jgi:hypothetical protein
MTGKIYVDYQILNVEGYKEPYNDIGLASEIPKTIKLLLI